MPLHSIVIVTTSGFIDTGHGILDGPNCLIFLPQVIQELPEFFILGHSTNLAWVDFSFVKQSS